jgi:hypothetical protein
MRQLSIVLPVAAALLLLSAAAPAKLYKWVDAQGNVTYSERKPPDHNAQEIKLLGVPAVSAEEARQRLDELTGKAETVSKDREFKNTVTAEVAERDKRLKENCETAQQNLRVLESASRVKDQDGQFMSDAQRTARLAQTRKEVEDSCN